MSMAAGFNAKILINDVRYTTVRWSARAAFADLPVTNTEGTSPVPLGAGLLPGTVTRLQGPTEAEAVIANATFDPTENPFAAPLSLGTINNYIRLQIFPAGLAFQSWLFPSLMIVQLSEDGDAPTLTPISILGRSNGLYFGPST